MRLPRVQPVAAFELESLSNLDLLDEGMGNSEGSDEFFAKDRDAAFGDRPHCQLGVSWHTKLSHEEDVEGHPKLGRNLGGHGNAAPGERQYDDIGSTGVLRQSPRKLPACIYPVPEAHDCTPTDRSASTPCPTGRQAGPFLPKS